MTIGEIVRLNNPSTYKKLMRISKSHKESKDKKIKLGDSVENLMKADSYKKVRGALRQKTWGK